MKRFFLFAMLLAVAACSNSKDNSKPRFGINFEGEQWDALSATTAGVSYSSDLVAKGYEWRDEFSSLSSKALVDDTYGYAYILSGMLVSSYNSSDINTYGDYTKDLYVYCATSTSPTEGGGNNGSDNFLIVVGNYNDSSNDDEHAEIFFADGVERRFLSCHVNSTTYFLNIVKNGNPYSPALGEGDEIIISATGYDSSGAKTGTVTMPFARKGWYVTRWTAWDLSPLGKVASIKFNVTGGPTTEWGMTTPKYFAIDDFTIEGTGTK